MHEQPAQVAAREHADGCEGYRVARGSPARRRVRPPAGRHNSGLVSSTKPAKRLWTSRRNWVRWSPTGPLFGDSLVSEKIVFSKLERDLFRERTQAGLAAAQARGRNGVDGIPKKWAVIWAAWPMWSLRVLCYIYP